MKFVNEKVFYKCFLVSNIPFDGSFQRIKK